MRGFASALKTAIGNGSLNNLSTGQRLSGSPKNHFGRWQETFAGSLWHTHPETVWTGAI